MTQSEKEKLEQSERQLKKMQKRLREEELKLLRGEKVCTCVQCLCTVSSYRPAPTHHLFVDIHISSQDLKEDEADIGFVSKSAASKKASSRAAPKSNGHARGGGGRGAKGGPQTQGSMSGRVVSDESASDMSGGDEASVGSDGTGGALTASDDLGSESGSDLIDADDQENSDDLSEGAAGSPGYDDGSGGSEEDF